MLVLLCFTVLFHFFNRIFGTTAPPRNPVPRPTRINNLDCAPKIVRHKTEIDDSLKMTHKDDRMEPSYSVGISINLVSTQASILNHD